MSPQTLHLVALLASASGAILAFVALRRARSRTVLAPDVVGVEAEPPGVLRGLVAPLANWLRPKSHDELEELRWRLLRAGRRGRDVVDRFLEDRAIALGIGLAVGITGAGLLGGGLGLIALLAGPMMGAVAPDRMVDSRAAARRKAVGQGLPAAMDLLVTCLDAGLAVNQAVSRLAKEISRSSPILAEELALTAREAEAGVPLPDAFRRLARRVDNNELSAMCALIAQAYPLGAPLAQMMRDHATATRASQLAAMEEQAGKVAVRMTMPLTLCLLPASLLAIVGPVGIQLVRALSR